VAKKITTKDLREMDDKKLAEHILGLEKDLLAAKKALADGSLPNPRVVSKAKKDIARAKTILNEKAKQEKGEK
jgi:large subunit ribosomal protein L29